MKRTVFFMLTFFMLGTLAAQQTGRGRGQGYRGGDYGTDKQASFEKLLDKKMEYIRREAGLTPHEYEAVAKIIRRYDRERFRLIRQRRQTIRALKKGQKLDAAKANTILDQLIEGDQKLWQLKIRYYKTLRQVLSPQKALAVIRAESSFRRRLVAPKRPSGPRVLNKRRRRPRFK